MSIFRLPQSLPAHKCHASSDIQLIFLFNSSVCGIREHESNDSRRQSDQDLSSYPGPAYFRHHRCPFQAENKPPSDM